MVKKYVLFVAFLIIILFAPTAPAAAEEIGSYTIRIGVNNDHTGYITKTITGIKQTIGSKEIIVETDRQGNPTQKAYLANQVIGEIKEIEPVTIPGKINWDKVREVKPLSIDFWLPNVIVGNTVNTDYSTRGQSEYRSAHNYRFSNGGCPAPQLVVQTDADTWMLIAIVNNPNLFKVEGSFTLGLAAQLDSAGNMTGYNANRTCTFPPGISYINLGSVNTIGSSFSGLLGAQGGVSGGAWQNPYAMYYYTTAISKIDSQIYPDEFKANGTMQGFIPVGTWQEGATTGAPVPVFTAEGGLRIRYSFTASGRAPMTFDEAWSCNDPNYKKFNSISGLADWDITYNRWIITIDRPEPTQADAEVPGYNPEQWYQQKELEMAWANDTLTQIFNKKKYIPPAQVSPNQNGGVTVMLGSENWQGSANFTLLWPKPVGVMNNPPGSSLNFAGWQLEPGSSIANGGNMLYPINIGALIDRNNTHTEHRYSIVDVVGDKYRLPYGSYWEVGRSPGTSYQPNGWMASLPVARTSPCFVDKYTFISDSNGSNTGFLSKSSVLGVMLLDSTIVRPKVMWSSTLKKIEVEIQDNSNARNSGTDVWTPENGWTYSQSPIIIPDWGIAIYPQDFTVMGTWNIKVTYDNVLSAVNPDQSPLSFVSTNGNFEFTQAYLKRSQELSDDSDNVRKNIETLIETAIKGQQPVNVTITDDPYWITSLSRIDMPAYSNNVIASTQKTITFKTTYLDYLCLGTKLNEISAACQNGLSNYNEEAIFPAATVLDLPPRDFTINGNIAFGGVKTLCGYGIQPSTGQAFSRTVSYGFNSAPIITQRSYIKQPLVFSDLSDTLLVYGDISPGWYGWTECRSLPFTSTNCLPWRIYDKATGKATLPDGYN